MRYLLIVCAVGVLALTAGFASAADPGNGQVPNAVLSQMGLGGLQPMTDAQGEHVRGMKFVKVSGSSFVLGLGGVANSSYQGQSYTKNSASGWNVAGVIQGYGAISTSPFNLNINTNFLIAGGASSVSLH